MLGPWGGGGARRVARLAGSCGAVGRRVTSNDRVSNSGRSGSSSSCRRSGTGLAFSVTAQAVHWYDARLVQQLVDRTALRLPDLPRGEDTACCNPPWLPLLHVCPQALRGPPHTQELNVSFTPGPYAACMRKWGCRGRTRCCAAVRDGERRGRAPCVGHGNQF